MVLFIISPLCLRVAGSVGPEIELLIGERRGSVRGLALELPRVGQVQAPCPSGGLSGKIGAMDRACERPAPLRAWPSGLLCVLLLLELGACGSHVPTTCGMGGGQPRPDIGGEILYMCYASGSIHGGLFLLNASSGQVRRLTPDNAWNLDASWSPDGRRIVYQSTRDGRSDVYVMDISTGSVRRLSDSRGFNGYPTWSPDGRWIAYESSRDGIEGRSDPPGFYREIYLVREDGSGLHRLLVTHASQPGPAWSPAGDQIAFASDMAAAYDVYTVAPDGRGLHQLTHHESGGGFFPYPPRFRRRTHPAFSPASSRSNPSYLHFQL